MAAARMPAEIRRGVVRTDAGDVDSCPALVPEERCAVLVRCAMRSACGLPGARTAAAGPV